ncbi:MAG: hypothetical protein HC802_18850 [Caldilineaceae bacterium]|nr:hypothetical protein [Caldilineaceae bacterium]
MSITRRIWQSIPEHEGDAILTERMRVLYFTLLIGIPVSLGAGIILFIVEGLARGLFSIVLGFLS